MTKMDDSDEVLFALVMACEHDDRHQAMALRTWLPRIKEWHRKAALRQDSSGGVLTAARVRQWAEEIIAAIEPQRGALGMLESAAWELIREVRQAAAPQESRSGVLENALALAASWCEASSRMKDDPMAPIWAARAKMLREGYEPKLDYRASRAEPGAQINAVEQVRNIETADNSPSRSDQSQPASAAPEYPFNCGAEGKPCSRWCGSNACAAEQALEPSVDYAIKLAEGFMSESNHTLFAAAIRAKIKPRTDERKS